VAILEVCGYPGCVWLFWRFVAILEACGYPGSVCGYSGGLWLFWRCVATLEVCGYPGGVWLFWRCLVLIPAGKTDNLDRGFSWFFSVLLRENSGIAARVRHDRLLPIAFQLVIN
jgi:hypothetical protein